MVRSIEVGTAAVVAAAAVARFIGSSLAPRRVLPPERSSGRSTSRHLEYLRER